MNNRSKNKWWTENEVNAIRYLVNEYSNEELAEMFKVTVKSIEWILMDRKIKRTSYQIKDQLKSNINMNIEVWLTHPEFDNIEVSNWGNVRNKDTKNVYKGYNSDGYRRCRISGKNRFIHRLIAEVYLNKPNNPKAKYINHKDGNRSNNRADNLEWVTMSENERHKSSLNGATINKKISDINKKDSNEYKEARISVIRNICKDLVDGKLTQSEIGRKYNEDPKFISAIKTKAKWKNISDEYF